MTIVTNHWGVITQLLEMPEDFLNLMAKLSTVSSIVTTHTLFRKTPQISLNVYNSNVFLWCNNFATPQFFSVKGTL